MGVNVIIQARMGSERLPGKVLKRLGNFTVLEYVVTRSKNIKGINNVIVATSILKSDDVIEEWCMKHEVICFRGSEKDVLDRFIACSKRYTSEYIIRVTADCPFVDFEMASEIVELVQKSNGDIVDIIGEVPRGVNVELISVNALQYIHANGKESRHREHVTFYAYEFKNEFNRMSYFVNENLKHPELRITIDTQEDYDLCEEVVKQYPDVLVPSKEVVKFLIQNPEISSINKHIIQKPVI